MRALLYCRQSDSRGAGADSLSIDSMVTELVRWCEVEGWDVAHVIREPDAKGWMDETQRPGIAEALELARAHDYEVFATWSMDRFARNVRIQEDLVYRFAALGVEVRSKTEPHVNRSPMVRQILGAVAEERTREISKHIKRALREKTRQGRWHGPPPYGHRRGPDGRLVPDEGEAPIVAEIVARVASWESYWAVALDLNRRGVGNRGTVWTHRTVSTVAGNPAHIGVCWAGDERCDGAHPAIVDRETWERCRARMADVGRRAKRRTSVATFLSGRARCGCGMPMYPILQVGGARANGKRYPCEMIRCRTYDGALANCDQPKRAIVLAKAHRFVREQLAADLEAAIPWRAALAQAKEEQKRAAPNVVSERARLEAQRKHLEAKRSRLIDDRADGLISKAEFMERAAPVDTDLAGITAKLAQTPAAPDPEAYREAGAVIAGMRAIVLGKDRGAVAGMDDETLAGMMVALGATFRLEGGEMRLAYGEPFGRMLGRD